jgi:NAD(P)-dependent dehydrogenase (short-subunit alcohol dehydrogenase family)
MKGKVALVTGGSSGIGLATAKAFVRQGARVVIASRRKAAATAALRELATEGVATWHPVDVADGKSVARLIETVIGEHGRLDYAFNNGGAAGVPRRLPACLRMPGARQSTDFSHPSSSACAPRFRQ